MAAEHDSDGPRRRYSGDRLDQAREHLADLDGPEIPSLWALRTLRDEEGLPVACGNVLVLDFEETRGDPRHGEMRSDDHVSHYAAVVPVDCDECDHDRAVYRYDAYHHIAGSFSVECRRCGAVLDSAEWA
jgi:hypothetical protein